MPPTDTSLAAPNGCPKLIILYNNSLVSSVEGRVQVSREGLYFVGIRDCPVLIRSSPRKTGFIGIEFCPHGAFPVFGIPMHETVNQLFDSEMVFGPWGRQAREALGNLEGVAQKLQFIQDQLIGLLHKNHRDNSVICFCVRTLGLAHGRIGIGELEQKTGYTRRLWACFSKTTSVFRPRCWRASSAFRSSTGNGPKGCHTAI
jgi:hypothetical protein